METPEDSVESYEGYVLNDIGPLQQDVKNLQQAVLTLTNRLVAVQTGLSVEDAAAIANIIETGRTDAGE